MFGFIVGCITVAGIVGVSLSVFLRRKKIRAQEEDDSVSMLW